MSLDKYRALLYKNWLLWKRRLGGSLCELLFPVAIFAILAILRDIVGSEQNDQQSFLDNAEYIRPSTTSTVTFTFQQGNSFDQCHDYIQEGQQWAIGLSPQDEITLYLQQKFLETPNLQGVEILYFDDDQELEDYVEGDDYQDGPKLCFAVVFSEIESNYYQYKIRYNQTESQPEGVPFGSYVDIFDFQTYDLVDDFIRTPKEEFQDQFIDTGFLQIQNWVDNYVFQDLVGNQSAYIAAGFIPMYFDDYVQNTFLSSVSDVLPFFFVLCYLVPVCRMISQIVEEKEYKIKEVIMIMGMSNKLYWLSWITEYFIIYTILALLAAIILGIQVFKYSNFFFIFLLFWLFGLSCLAYSLLVSVFFSRGKSAITIGLMVFLGLFFVFFAVNDERMLQANKYLASFIPSVAFGLSLIVIGFLQETGLGLRAQFVDLNIYYYTILGGYLFILADIIILVLLAIYFEQVWPREWGVSRPWNFLCKKSFWTGKTEQADREFDKDYEPGESEEKPDPTIEAQKENGKAMLVRGLSKEYDKGVRAVDNLNLDIYEGQITALLGHNGAGKTTTISMLTGLIESTGGDMTVGGNFLSTDLEKIRSKLGICPQQNVLWKELTVYQHLYLFSRFKGMKDQEKINEKIQEKIQEVQLTTQRDKLSEHLSGGQKRKLQLALALIGDSEIVLLDQPTSGMDLTARRLMWDMLKNNKANRIIILTTHYMQEADVLADRICIISHGKLRCCGSSLFLKARYGVGYYLVFVKEQDVDSPEHSQKIKDFVVSFIPEAKKMSDVHAEISFQLPLNTTDKFQEFFKALDDQSEKLQIRSYAISVTTLEEVFIRVARGDQEMRVSMSAEKPEFSQQDDEEVRLIQTKRDTKGLFLRHLMALLVKRWLWNKRDFKALIFEFVVPILLVVIGMAFMMIRDTFTNVDPIDLLMTEYQEPQSLLYNDQDGFVDQLMVYIDGLPETESEAILVDDLQDFDQEIFEKREDVEDEIYRMGSYYYDYMDENTNQFQPIVFHNQTSFQSPSIIYQFVSLAIIKQFDDDIEIKVQNHPLPITQQQLDASSGGDGVLSSLVFGLAFAFIPAGIVAYIVKEREMNVKHQHLISGVSLWAYWIINYLWDILVSTIVAILAALIILAFGMGVFTQEQDDFNAILLLFVFFGLAAVPFTYCISFFFKNYSSAQSATLIFYFITGAIFPIAVYICFIFEVTRDFIVNFSWLLRVIPSFCLGHGVIFIGSDYVLASFAGESEPYEAFSFDSAGADILMLGIFTVIYPIILLLLQWRESNPYLRKLISVGDVPPGQYTPDPDVEYQKEKALNTDPQEVLVNVRSLRKVFKSIFEAKSVAVQDVSFNIPKLECFALLGVNGAGKTTTFKMLTGEYASTSGEAYLGGYSVTKELDKARQNIGYCPQFDALSQLLTCRQHLKFYCQIKGIEKSKIEELTIDLLTDLDLLKYTDYRAGSLSGGNKRKLSVAIALIGDPTVVFLDEPSSGMDPETRKKLWKVLGNIKKRDSAVILTTHSMEEAEALCDRMAIMVNGRFKCIGTPNHLRNQFGQGYELELKIKIPKREVIEELASRLDTVLGDSPDIKKDQLKECLKVLEAENLEEEISLKGTGSGLFYQMENDGVIQRDGLVTWVLIQRSGNAIFDFLRGDFEQVSLVEHYLSLYKFRIEKQEGRSLGYLFSAIEKNKKEFCISEYALSQTSLDQIFTTFAIQGEKEKRERHERSPSN